jgi:ankyrin repeat protein
MPDLFSNLPLDTAIIRGNYTVAHLLIEKRADMTISSWSPHAVLLLACARDWSKIALHLIERGASVNGNMMKTACEHNSLRVVRLLLDRKVDVNALNIYRGFVLKAVLPVGLDLLTLSNILGKLNTKLYQQLQIDKKEAIMLKIWQ